MKLSRVSILVLALASVLVAGSAAAQQPVRSLQDLIGARGGDGEYQMQQRGYTFVSTQQDMDSLYSFWREPRSYRCVSVRTSDGRYQSIVYVPDSDCGGGHGQSGARNEIITCSSQGHDHHYCPADTSGGVTLVHQLSHSGCWEGDTWGYDHRGIWVANGCRAEFQVGRSDYSASDSYYYNSGSSSRYDVDHHQHDEEKTAAIAVGAVIAAGLIAAAAQQHDYHADARVGSSPRDLVSCESLGRDHTYCSVGNYVRHVELKRQLSRSSCEYNRTWGYDRSGIWVADGCRAEFWVD
jgi:hypothetical protein